MSLPLTSLARRITKSIKRHSPPNRRPIPHLLPIRWQTVCVGGGGVGGGDGGGEDGLLRAGWGAGGVGGVFWVGGRELEDWEGGGGGAAGGEGLGGFHGEVGGRW